MDWTPTHRIVIERRDGSVRYEEVMDVDGVLYTLGEWSAETGADWWLDDARLMFQGAHCGLYHEAVNGGSVHLERIGEETDDYRADSFEEDGAAYVGDDYEEEGE